MHRYLAILSALLFIGFSLAGMRGPSAHETAFATSTQAAAPLPALQQAAASSPGTYRVVKVVDGDTLDVDLSGTTTRLRLIGIDTPEVVDPRKPVQCFGKAASDEAKALLSGHFVRIEHDPAQGERDKYGRLLAYVYLPDGTFFNLHMIEAGFAHEYTYRLPYKYQGEFKAAERTAREQKRGLWADGACAAQSARGGAQ